MKAREIIAAELFWPFEIVYGDPSEAANDYAARIVSQLAKAGFVILPKDLVEEVIDKGIQYQSLEEGEAYFGPDVKFEELRAMISHAEGEKG